MSEASDPTQSQGQTQPGWYPDPTNGQLRWWDGTTWGPYQEAGVAAGAAPMPVAGASTTDPKQMASWAHYSGALLLLLTCGLGWLGPLIIFMTSGQNDPFIKDQSAEALNFQITIAIAAFVSGLLTLVIIGFALLPIVWLAGMIFGFLGGSAASKGEWYRYPFALRLVKGA